MWTLTADQAMHLGNTTMGRRKRQQSGRGCAGVKARVLQGTAHARFPAVVHGRCTVVVNERNVANWSKPKSVVVFFMTEGSSRHVNGKVFQVLYVLSIISFKRVVRVPVRWCR